VKRLALALVFLSGFALSCGHDDAVRPTEAAVHMEVTVSSATGDVGRPITVTTRVTNVGAQTVDYFWACNEGSFMRLTDPELRHVNRLCGTCPNVLCVACFTEQVHLAPGKTVEESFVYSGELRDCLGSFPGASGEYRVDAEFRGTSTDGTQITVEKSVRFTWAAN
jgi:hypothetical protein